MKFLTFFFVFFLLCCTGLFAQNKSGAAVGILKGNVRDSVYNHAMKSTTVSIHSVNDNKIINYQVTNNIGDFVFPDLPLSKELKLIISHVGYRQVVKTFTIEQTLKLYDFKTIYVSQKTNQLEEVTVTIPPIQMNGDTLEFNAAAFKLDSNAVVQDLMKKIPNITQWGDGRITVNGREVKSLLVNGREFMGGDAKISIENIPKNALEKIQVYNTIENPKNLQDSSLNMNLKLKKGKDFGYFGKVGAGLGNNQKYESDLAFNVFSPKLQLSLVGASNNVNKIASDVNTLLRNSTFKGVGVQLDYMSDFRTVGINQPNSAGYSFKYDFRDLGVKTISKNLLSSEYFLQSNHIIQSGENQITTSLGNKTDITEGNSNSNNTKNTNHRFNNRYQFAKDKFSFDISQNILLSTIFSEGSNISTSLDNNQNIVSKSINENKNSENNKTYGLKTGVSFRPNIWDIDNRFSGFDIDYSINITEKNNNKENIIDFMSTKDPTKDRFYNRIYDNNSQAIDQNVSLNLSGILKLILGPRQFDLFDIDIKNNMKFSNTSSHNRVFDYKKDDNKLLPNEYLTNNNSYNTFLYQPVFNFNKIINKRLTNRYDKTWSFSVDLLPQFFYQNNRSEKDFQNLNRTYSNFLPSANISFSDNQFGEYRKTYSISYDTKISAPQIWQIAPLTDSTNVYFLRAVNLNLKEERTESIAFNFKRSNDKKDDFEYKIEGFLSKTNNNIIDSTRIDEQNVRTVYLINNSENFTYGLNGSLNKAFKLRTGEIQINFNSDYNYNKSPNIINEIKNSWSNNNFNNSLRINYSYKSDFTFEGKQQFVISTSKNLDQDDETFINTNSSTSLSFSINATKKIKVNSNISFSSAGSSGLRPINYNIWNVSATYRFLKGNNLEMKLSALDLLHQNTSIITRNKGGVITLGNQNVLQQYFMIGLSYYPRKFGK